MNKQLIVFQLIAICLSINGVLSSEIGVPVLLWQQKTDSHLFDSKSTVNQIDGKVLADDYLTSTQTIVAFVQNRLSLEQFTAEDEERLTAVRSIFKDQSIKPTLLTDVLNPTEALTSKHFQRQSWDGIHVKNGDKVWVELPEDSLAENNEMLSQLMANIRKNISKNALFLITGRQNQFRSIDLETPEVHIRRERAVEESATTEAPKVVTEEESLINIDDCLFYYTSHITLNNITTDGLKALAHFNTTQYNHNGSYCWTLYNGTDAKANHTNQPGLLHVLYDDTNGTQITLNFVIENPGSNYFWGIQTKESSVFVKSDKHEDLKDGLDFPLTNNIVESEQSFGFSCSRLHIGAKANNTKKDEMMSISLIFSNFQLQPFLHPFHKPGQKYIIFTETFDCEVWMTLPLWMGLLVLLLMFVILSAGVYFIAIVNTPDRFENPKAKPLVINAIED